jgi:hypothetical protein
MHVGGPIPVWSKMLTFAVRLIVCLPVVRDRIPVILDPGNHYVSGSCLFGLLVICANNCPASFPHAVHGLHAP